MYNIGDVVMLRSGGQKMTVTRGDSSGKSNVTCAWMQPDGYIVVEEIAVGALMPAPPAPTPPPPPMSARRK